MCICWNRVYKKKFLKTNHTIYFEVGVREDILKQCTLSEITF